MAYKRQEKPAENKAPAHFGFDERGSVIRSEVPFKNRETTWVRNMCRSIPQECLSPAQVVEIAERSEPWVRDLFSPTTLDAWRTVGRFNLWPTCHSARAVERTLMHHGRGLTPPWRDDHAWATLCEKALRLSPTH